MSFSLNASNFSQNVGYQTNTGDISVYIFPETNNTPDVLLKSNTGVYPYSGGVSGIAASCQCFWAILNTTNVIPPLFVGYVNPGGGNVHVTASQLNSMGIVLGVPGRYFIGQPLIMLYSSYLTYQDNQPNTFTLPNEFLIPAPPGGSLNPYGGIQISISFVVQPCGVPTSLSAIAYQNAQIPLSWAPPSDDGGSAISSYIVQYNTTGSAPWTQINTGSSSPNYTITGLSNGTTYFFQVAAVNGYCNNGTGYGPLSGLFTPIGSTTPATTPDPPSSVTATGGVVSIYATWNTPNNGGAEISSYTIGYGVSGAGITNTIGGISPISLNYTITGLSNGTSYDVQVAAVNIVGQGSYSFSVTTTTFNIPTNPTGLSGNSGNTQVTLNWTAPSNDGGTPVTQYLVEYKLDSDSSWTQIYTGSTAVTYIVGPPSYSLVNGSLYDFRVSAINIIGTSSPSNIINVTPSTIPSAPVITSSLSYQNQQSLVTWSPPTDTGGATITSYNLQYSTSSTGPWLTPTPSSVSPPTTSYTFTGLTNGTLYYFQVAAINLNGAGNYSSQTIFSNATPATTPDPPINISTTAGVNSISVVWDDPPNTGGAAVTSYTLQYRILGSGSSFTPVTGIPISPTPPHYTIGSLAINTTYEIQVAAVNPAGQGSYSASVTGVTDNTPDNPTNLQGNYGNQQVTLTWIAPTNDGGTPITEYLVEYKLNYVSSWTQIYTGSTALTYIVGPPSYSLVNGSLYDFRVSGVNLVGVGSHSNIIEVTPSTTPGPSVIISSEGCNNQQSLVTWSPPADTGGAPILSYNLQYSTTSTGPWLPTPPYSVPAPPVSTITTSTIYNWLSLANGQSKTFVVNNASSYQIGNNIKITYSNSDSITGTITGISGNNVTITITSFANAGYTSSTIYTTTAPNGTLAGSINSGEILNINSAVSTPNPPLIPANTIITGGQSYIIQASTATTFQIQLYNQVGGALLGTSDVVATSVSSGTPNTLVFSNSIFTSSTLQFGLRLVNNPVPVNFNFPLGGSFSPSDFCGFLQGYTLGYSQGTIDILPITISYTFTGLTNGTQYYFQVQAVNMNGPGPYSAQTANSTAIPSITPQPPPIPITTTAITSSSITLSWTAPTNTGGNPVTGYLIYWSQVSPSGTIIPPINSYNTTTSGTPLATTYTITGLTYATLYAFQISSINCSGIGPISAPAFYVTTSSIPPSAPTNLTITGCNTGYTNSVILTWTAPASNGGSPITNYIVYYRTTSPVGTWYTYNTNSNATTAIVPLPASSTSYDFKVAAQNIAGVSIFSPIVSSSSYNPPTAPTNHTATNFVSNTTSNGSIVLTWTPSTQEPPQTISYYVVEYKICEFGGYVTYPTTITFPSNSVVLSNIGASSSSNIANNVPYLFRVYAVNSCGARSPLSNTATATSYNNAEPTRLWSRFNLNCSGNITSFDSLTRNMLRKGQVLQYPVVGTLQYSRATLWSMAAKNQLTRKKAWASQSEEYTYPNTTNINNEPDVGLRQTPTSLVCWRQPPSLICNSSTASDVPGNPTTLCLSKNAPFDNFRRPITYSSGGTKFPVFFSK